jgi:hypothetical protein
MPDGGSRIRHDYWQVIVGTQWAVTAAAITCIFFNRCVSGRHFDVNECGVFTARFIGKRLAAIAIGAFIHINGMCRYA